MTVLKWSVLTTLAMCAAAAVRPACAQSAEAPPVHQVRDTLGATANNPGLQNALDVSWGLKRSSSTRPIRRNAHISAGLSHYLSPSYTRVGAWIEISPLSILDVRIGAEPTVYFGTFESLMSFDRYTDRFDND